ncbi:hypothetical protein TNCV_1581991 [Trichonephila clavipes]|nr:hypothetical protein TNCV_1581991 [Trichonephila clavipes]
MLEKVIENWTSRLDYIRASRGSRMPDIIFKIAANRVPAPRVLSANDSKESHPTSGFLPQTSYTTKTVSVTTPPFPILPTNQETLFHQAPATSGHIQQTKYGMEERFTFHFPVTSSVQN